VFVADLRPRPGGRLLHAARMASAFASQPAWQLHPSPTVHDAVVSRRDDGAEVLRMPAGDPLDPGTLLARVRGELDPATFLAGWQRRSSPDD
jgi:hypothetical protein